MPHQKMIKKQELRTTENLLMEYTRICKCETDRWRISTKEPDGGLKAVRNRQMREEKELTVWWAPSNGGWSACEIERTSKFTWLECLRERGKVVVRSWTGERFRERDGGGTKLWRFFLGSLRDGDGGMKLRRKIVRVWERESMAAKKFCDGFFGELARGREIRVNKME